MLGFQPISAAPISAIIRPAVTPPPPVDSGSSVAIRSFDLAIAIRSFTRKF